MEALPLELLEHIFSYLLHQITRAQIVSLPVSTALERTDIYSLRLTSVRICKGALQTFVRLIEDVPTACRENTLKNLAALLDQADVSSAVSCLALNTRKLFRAPELPEQDTNVDLRIKWMDEKLPGRLVSIMQKTPRLRHLMCVIEGMDEAGLEARIGIRQRQHELLKKRVAAGPDPWHIAQGALVTSGLKDSLESLVLLYTRWEGLAGRTDAPELFTPLVYPRLQHLTYALTGSHVSDCRLGGPNLTSMHLVVDSYSCLLDDDPSSSKYFPKLYPTLRHLTINGDNDWVQTDILFACVSPVLRLQSKLAQLTIRDVKIVVDIGDDEPELSGPGGYNLLIFNNVRYCLTDAVTLSGPSTPKYLDVKCKPYVELMRYATKSCILPDRSGDRPVPSPNGVERPR